MNRTLRWGIVCLWVGVLTGGANGFFETNRRVEARPASQGSLEEKNGVFVAQEGGKVLMQYKYKGVPFKPYVQQLYTPGGVQVLFDAPPDHLHHHALMFAIGANDVDFWAEAEKCGKQLTRSIAAHSPGPQDSLELYRLTSELDWVAAEGQSPVLKEKRTVEVASWEEQKATLLNWRSVCVAPEPGKSVKLFGSHYFGLGMRFLPSMDKTGTFLNSSGQPGEIVRNDERNVAADWCAYQVTSEGKPVTVAVFASPKNLPHPAVWFTMKEAFAYLSATLNLYKAPMELKPDEKLDLQYGVVLWDGTISAEQIGKAYQAWLGILEKGAK
jgi:hypothetical protein